MGFSDLEYKRLTPAAAPAPFLPPLFVVGLAF